MARRRTITPAYKEALQRARRDKLEQRAKLINAGIIEPKTKGRSKYHQVKAVVNGQTYDSMGEAEFSHKLELRRIAGEIISWERPKPIVLVDAPTPRGRVTYKPDFLVYRLNGTKFYIDFKSKATETQSFRIKVKIWAQKIPEELRVAYATGEEKIVAQAHK